MKKKRLKRTTQNRHRRFAGVTLLAALAENLSGEAAALRQDSYRAAGDVGKHSYSQACHAAAETLDGIVRAINSTITERS